MDGICQARMTNTYDENPFVAIFKKNCKLSQPLSPLRRFIFTKPPLNAGLVGLQTFLRRGVVTSKQPMLIYSFV